MIVSKEKQDSMVSPLHFARFEIKYILSSMKRAELEKDLDFFLELDPFVEGIPEQKYFVRSLYYDDPFYSAFYDKTEGLLTRSKFRLRTYGHHADNVRTIFLEIKGRHNNVVFKHRTPIKLGDVSWRGVAGDGLAKTVLDNAEPSQVINQFHYELLRKKLRPVALIDYERRPYYSKYDRNFRITFDENLKASQVRALFPSRDVSPREILPGYTVLEVKFKHQMPSWFHRIIQTHELKRVSISKICSGMEVLGIAIDE